MRKGIMLVGEPMGLFIAQNEGKLEDAAGFSMAAAGAELNVAIGLSRLEHKVTYLTKLGDDPFGKFILKTLASNNISSEFVTLSNERATGFMLKNRVSSGDPEIFYFRKSSAASTLSKEDVEKIDFSNYGILHMTGILPALSDSTRAAAFSLIEKARENGLVISFDPNLRPQLWESKEIMISTINQLASMADIVLPGIGEGEILCGSRDPKVISDFYLSRGAKTVIVKLGKDGAFAKNAEGELTVPEVHVDKVIDTVGAGDGFAAGVLSAIIEEKSLYDCVYRGNAIGAIQVTSRGDNEGLPTRKGLAAFLKIATID